MGARRQRRIGELLREELSALIADLKDPRVSGVTVTAVEPAPDRTIAKVYVTAWPTDPARREEVLAGLEHAKGYLKHELAGRVILRAWDLRTPRISAHRCAASTTTASPWGCSTASRKSAICRGIRS